MEIPSAPAPAPKRRSPALVVVAIVALVGAVIAAVSLVAFVDATGRVSTLERRISDLSDRLDSSQESMAALVLALDTGPDDVQRWIDNGSVRLPELTAASFEAPVLCTGELARWSLLGTGLTC